MTPTQRSLKKLRDEGYRAAVVEKWNAHARIRQDLFGVIDILAVREGETLGVQATSGSNVSSRLTKLSQSEAIPDLRSAGWTIQVHGWRKNAQGKWNCRVEDIS